MKTGLWIGFCLGIVVNSNFSVGQEAYREPPQQVVDIIDADPAPAVSFSRDRQWMAFLERNAMPDIADISRRMLRLAGMRIDPQANSRFATSFFKKVKLKRRSDGKEFPVALPAGVKISGTSWSHRNNAVAITVVQEDGTHLYVVDLAEPDKVKKLTSRLSTVIGGIDWTPDGSGILCQLVPEDRGAEPEASRIPVGPNVQESAGNKSPTRTYQDLLQNPYDEALFEYYVTNELVLLNLDGTKQKLGDKAIYGDAAMSPDGKHLLVTRIQKPFSCLMTVRSFPRSVEVWDMNGKMEYKVADVPMEENIPIEGVPTGRRRIDWMSARDATLIWTEALDGGDPNRESEYRDQLYMMPAPFDGPAIELRKLRHRFAGVTYMQDPSSVALSEYDRDRRWITSKLYDLTEPAATPQVLMDRSIRDRYGDPGGMVEVPDETGHSVVLQRGDVVYRIGSGASPKGNLPFIDRFNIKTMKTERVWRCEEGLTKSRSDCLPPLRIRLNSLRLRKRRQRRRIILSARKGGEKRSADELCRSHSADSRHQKGTGNVRTRRRCAVVGDTILARGTTRKEPDFP